jgi:hypothetical protein
MNCAKNCESVNVTKEPCDGTIWDLSIFGGTIWKSSEISPVEKRKKLDCTEMLQDVFPLRLDISISILWKSKRV